MNLRKLYKLSLYLTVLMLGLCLSHNQSFAERIITDQSGRIVTLPDNIKRVVSLAPSVTEIIFALDQQELLKGVTQYSDYPAEAKLLPRVGSYVRLDLEKIVSLRPEVCIAVKDGNPIEIVNRLTDLGIPVYATDVHDTQSVMAAIIDIGNVLGAGTTAKLVSDSMRKRIDRIRGLAGKADHQPGVFMQIAISPIISIGSNTFIDELIRLAGGRNLAAGSTPYPRFSKEQIIAMNPEIFIVSSMTGEVDVERVKREWEAWPQIRAVKNKRIYLINADLINRPGPRLADGLEALAPLIHPELYK